MTDTIKIGRKNQIVIPKKIRQQLNLSEGKKLFLEVKGENIIMTVIPDSIEEIAGIGKGLF